VLDRTGSAARVASRDRNQKKAVKTDYEEQDWNMAWTAISVAARTMRSVRLAYKQIE
jgi:hypothetical protein